ncbi:MAG: hypothetical protein FJX67_19440, partial [Alphaproteobacteria bacterium]|nr:hypothetical protein [Alphaproteobacteria bacterium]
MKIRVYLATTVGLVLIQRIQRETAPLSMVCRNGTLHEVQPMSGHYNAFVRAPSGVIEREFGPFEPGGFRLDVAAEVGDGDSWQLGVFIAHALKSQEQLAEAGEEFAAAVVATGEVDHDLNAIRVGHVPAKIAAARAALADLAARVPTTFVLPAANAHQVPAEALPANVRLLAVASARDALATVAAPGSSPVEARPTPTAAPPPVPQRRRRLVGSAVAAAVIVLAIGGAWALLRVDGPVPGTPPPAAVPAPVAVAPPVQRAPDPGA